MTSLLRYAYSRGVYSSRRIELACEEPVFGRIKEDRGFRHFPRRGLMNVRGEWTLIRTVHNLLKPAAVRSAARAWRTRGIPPRPAAPKVLFKAVPRHLKLRSRSRGGLPGSFRIRRIQAPA